jgi:gamma-glutamyl-gamma-aminobutyrate hydrolase PuuD
MTRLASALYQDYGPFLELNGVSEAITLMDPNALRSTDILLLHGGEDISPSLYNHAKHPYTSAPADRPSKRDAVEWALLQRAIELNIPIIGICRGAQMLCAAAGGYLIQHVENHGGFHDVVCSDGSVVETNSCHHQMQYPFDVEHELLMWIEHKRSSVHYVGTGRSVTNALPCEPETVYYPKIRGFAPQWHPEWLADDSAANQKLLQMINERL